MMSAMWRDLFCWNVTWCDADQCLRRSKCQDGRNKLTCAHLTPSPAAGRSAAHTMLLWQWGGKGTDNQTDRKSSACSTDSYIPASFIHSLLPPFPPSLPSFPPSFLPSLLPALPPSFLCSSLPITSPSFLPSFLVSSTNKLNLLHVVFFCVQSARRRLQFLHAVLNNYPEFKVFLFSFNMLTVSCDQTSGRSLNILRKILWCYETKLNNITRSDVQKFTKVS